MSNNNVITKKRVRTDARLRAARLEAKRARRELAAATKKADAAGENVIRMLGELKRSMREIA